MKMYLFIYLFYGTRLVCEYIGYHHRRAQTSFSSYAKGCHCLTPPPPKTES
jgi:hypothetical protein